jgi:putative chitinase
MITNEQLKAITGIKDDVKINGLISGLTKVAVKYEINTKLRLCHFLAQLMHESGGFSLVKENLNYSADGLLKIFPKYFPTKEIATAYARQPQKIANKVYGNRMGNGNEASGDGFKYSGKGYIQITGKENYALLTKDTGTDFVNHPELLLTNENAIMSAGWYWNSRKLNAYADIDDILTITKKINGGTIGLEDRKAQLTKCKQIIK